MFFQLTRAAMQSLSYSFSSFLRAVIALVIITVTWWMTYRDLKIGEEWQAVFLIVLGFYFAERPSRSPVVRDVNATDEKAASHHDLMLLSELSWQFILAVTLVVGAIAAFLYPAYEGSISGVWIGGVVLAVGFYFKDARIFDTSETRWFQQTLEVHQAYRAVLAVLVTAGTIPLVVAAGSLAKTTSNKVDPIAGVPLQWVAVVLIVVAFYFKEKRDSSNRNMPT